LTDFWLFKSKKNCHIG